MTDPRHQVLGAYPALGSPLTQRETEVAYAIARGLSRGEVGSELGISTTTVAKHLTLIFRRLGVSSQIEMMIALGLVVTPSTERVGLIAVLAGLRERLTAAAALVGELVDDIDTAGLQLADMTDEVTPEPGEIAPL